jgi:hypothetical protein
MGILAGAPVSICATFYSDFLACMDTCSVVDPECFFGSGSDFSDSSGSGPWILFRILHEFILNLGTFLFPSVSALGCIVPVRGDISFLGNKKKIFFKLSILLRNFQI